MTEASDLRTRAEAALAQSADLIVYFSSDGVIESASPACRRMFGIEPEELVGVNGLSMIHQADRARVMAELATLPQHGAQVRTVFRVVAGQHGVRWLEQVATNLLHEPGVRCVVGTFRDVTDRVELLRRSNTDARRLGTVLRFGSLEIDITGRQVRREGRDLDLTEKEFDLLAFLAEHDGQVFPRADLLREVWHSSPSWQSPATVTEHVHRLRGRIEIDPRRPRLIKTVRGSGYSFGAPVRSAALPA